MMMAPSPSDRILSAVECEDLLARITYKPGWDLHLAVNMFDGEVALRLRFRAPSSREGKGQSVQELARVSPVPDRARANEGAFRNFVWNQVFQFERHEAEEWFAFDGVQVVATHPGEEPQRTNQDAPEPYREFPMYVPKADPAGYYRVDL